MRRKRAMLENLLMDLENTAEWRHKVQDEFPEDSRNQPAAQLLECLKNEIESNPDSPLAREVEELETELVELSDGNHRYDLSAMSEEINDYRRRIGFSEFPKNGEDYLSHLLEIYKSH